jgi:hypothetical protein
MEGAADQSRHLVCVLNLLRPFDRRASDCDEIAEQRWVGAGMPRILLATFAAQHLEQHGGAAALT